MEPIGKPNNNNNNNNGRTEPARKASKIPSSRIIDVGIVRHTNVTLLWTPCGNRNHSTFDRVNIEKATLIIFFGRRTDRAGLSS